LCSLYAFSYSSSLTLSFLFMIRPPPPSTLFPYTMLFRSLGHRDDRADRAGTPDGRVWHRLYRPRGDGQEALEPRQHSHAYRAGRSEEHTSELQSLRHLVCRLLLEKINYLSIILPLHRLTP